jgi:hypothetical protein
VASIVEGDGEVPALPKLLHRIAAEIGVPSLLTPTPMRIPRGKITITGGIERSLLVLSATQVGTPDLPPRDQYAIAGVARC